MCAHAITWVRAAQYGVCARRVVYMAQNMRVERLQWVLVTIRGQTRVNEKT